MEKSNLKLENNTHNYDHIYLCVTEIIQYF